MEQTQLLAWDEDGDPPEPEAAGGTPRPVGRLHLLSSRYGPEQDFWIYPGENVVGRLPSCRVCLPAPSVSKAHAVIEVPAPGGPHLLYDRGSLNRTRRRRDVLRPQVRYSLDDGDTLLFGDVGCQYFLLPPGGAGPEDSLEVPPTQPRPPNTLAIEETPGPSKRMGYGALLARDSEDEEEPRGGGRLLELPGSNGSDSSADTGDRSNSAFSSPSATVVPESDEEGGETPDPPCPSLRLRYSSEKAPGPPENGVAAAGPEQPRAMGVAGTDPEADEGAGPRGPALAKGPGHAGRGSAGTPERPAVGGLRNGCPVEAGGHTDVEEAVRHTDVGQRNRGPAFLGDSNTDVKENAGRPAVVGSDTDVEEEKAENPDVVRRPQQRALRGDRGAEGLGAAEDPGVVHPKGRQPARPGESDAHLAAAPANPDAAPGTKGRPAVSEDSDTDVEATGVDPDVVGPKSPRLCGELDSDTDVEGAAESPDVVQQNQRLAVPRGGETEVDGGVETPSEAHPKRRPSAQNGDSDTDVEEAAENPDVARKAHRPAMGVGSDTDVEEETEKDNPDVTRKAHQPAMEVGSDTDVEEEIEKDNPDVARKAHLPAMEVGSDTDVEEEKADNPDVVRKARLPATEVGSDTDVEEGVDNPDVAQTNHRLAFPGGGEAVVARPVGNADVQRTHDRLAAPGDSDTDVEEAEGNPDVATKTRWPAVQADSDTDVEDELAKIPDVVTTTHRQAVSGSSDTDVTGVGGKPDAVHPTGQQPAENGDSDTDVEEAAGHTDVGRPKDPLPAVAGDSDTDVEETAERPAVAQLESGGCSDTDVEDDADFALQATQCYLAEETPSPGAEAARAPAAAGLGSGLQEEATQMFIFKLLPPAKASVMSPPAGPALHAPVCASSEKDSDSDPEPCVAEATQSFCEDLGRHSDQPTQPFIREEEEETQLLPRHPPPGGAPSAEPAPLPFGPQTPSVAPPNLEGGSGLPGGAPPAGGTRRGVPEEEEAQPRRLVLSAPRRPAPVLQGGRAGAESGAGSAGQCLGEQGGPEVAARQETPEAAGGPGAGARPAGARPEDAGKVPEAPPIPSTTGRRRSLRSAAVPTPPPPAPGPERRSQRSRVERGRPGEGAPVGAGEPSQPGPAAPRLRGRRQLCSRAVYMEEPEPGDAGAVEAEPSGPIKRPRRGAGNQAPPTEPEAPGQARRSRGAAGPESSPANAPRRVSRGTEPEASQGRARRSQRAPAQEPAAKRRGAPEPAGEAREKGRGVATPEPPRAQGGGRAARASARGPEDAGSGTSKKQEAPAPPLRRQSTEEVEAPRARAPRRSQGAVGAMASPRVLFTGVIDEAGEEVVLALGGTLARSVFDCTHLVTDRVRRTVKFLCALARGVPIVTLDWLDKSGRSGCFLSPGGFLVRDTEQERNFHFSLAQSLQRARREPLLQGYEIHVTPNVRPEPEHMKDIIQCSGGVFLPHMPRGYKDQRIVISCPEDLPRCRPALSARLPIASPELILTGILQQIFKLAPYRLDGSPPSSAAPVTRGSKRKGASGSAPAPPCSAKRRR